MTSAAGTADAAVVRDLAARYRDVCADPVQARRRDLWRRHNSLQATPPPIYIRAFAFFELPESTLRCEDPFLRGLEADLRYRLLWSTLDDDSPFEPWLTIPAVHRCSGWGVPVARHTTGRAGGSFKVDYPLKTPADVDKLRVPRHDIDEAATAERVGRARDVLGEILTVDLDRGPAYRQWSADLSTDLGYLRGIEHFMLDMVDDAAGLHRLVGFLAAGVKGVHDEAEAAGDWGLTCHQNQAMPYALELPDPAPNVHGAARKQLWVHVAAQEFTAVSPAMHEEFLLRYQLPIMAEFGLVAYGCCEDLSAKIPMLRAIPNLRRIAVSPFADVARCAQQMGRDYVFSYRPSPTDTVGYGWDEGRVRRILRRDLDACRGCCVDITLKDVETVQGELQRVRRFVQIVRELTAS
jgi:hypothetical protein